LQANGKACLLVGKTVGLKKDGQIGEHHPEGKKIEKVGEKKYNRSGSAHSWSQW
jgi:hypothetical protein